MKNFDKSKIIQIHFQFNYVIYFTKYSVCENLIWNHEVQASFYKPRINNQWQSTVIRIWCFEYIHHEKISSCNRHPLSLQNSQWTFEDRLKFNPKSLTKENPTETMIVTQTRFFYWEEETTNCKANWKNTKGRSMIWKEN